LSLDKFSHAAINGVSYTAPLTESDITAIGDRLELMTEDFQFLRIRRNLGDLGLSSHPSRSQVTRFDVPHLADWVGEGETGADAAKAYRWYRFKVRVGPRFPTEHLNIPGEGYYVKLLSCHPQFDDDDTAGLQNAFNVSVRRDAFGRNRFCILQNADPDEITTVEVFDVHQNEIYSWPFHADWVDILFYLRWSHSDLGEMKVWINRRLAVNRMGVGNTMNNAPSRGAGGGPYPTLGITGSPDVAQDCDHCGIIVADGAYSLDNFQQMYPEDPDAIPLERVTGPPSFVF
jgi:hypothetical protein